MASERRGEPAHRGEGPPSRVVIEGVKPEIDGGLFPIKRTVGEEVVVVGRHLRRGPRPAFGRRQASRRGRGGLVRVADGAGPATTAGPAASASIPRDGTSTRSRRGSTASRSWQRDLSKKVEAGAGRRQRAAGGAELVRKRPTGAGAPRPTGSRQRAGTLGGQEDQAARVQAALDPELAVGDGPLPRPGAAGPTTAPCGSSSSASGPATAPGTRCSPARPRPSPAGTARSATSRRRLPYVAGMGFDVLYLPPIHPIGRAFRKGPNNTLTPGPDDPGSPWAIGGRRGRPQGHPSRARHARRFRPPGRRRPGLGLEIALDIAFQCSPDHPYVREHPAWFRHRPDGTIKYAENPPKKYQDIYPIDFESDDWRALWDELRDVFLFWIGRGVKIFRVDNPHTKPFRFWDWVIAEVRDRHPDAIFLSEAFTRPKVMRRLAKGGYTQSYTYFTWRNTKQELTEYFTELTQTDSVEIMRPNLFANTPDILHEYLQYGGRPAFQIRLVLAATLGATYGIYGPPFEQCVGQPGPPRLGGVPRLREVPGPALGPRRPGEPARLHRPDQRDPPREPRAAPRPQPPVLPRRQRPDPLLRQGDARPVEHRPGGRQPRPVPHPVGLGPPPVADWACGRRVVPGPRPDRRRPLPLARASRTSSSSTRTPARHTSSGSGGRSRPNEISIITSDSRRRGSSSRTPSSRRSRGFANRRRSHRP